MSKILIIDDSAQMSHLLKEMVTIFGHEAEIAHSGTEGIQKVSTFKPDLILLDIMMPGMDGWTFFEKHSQQSKIPVIMISADASFATRRKADDIGVMLLEKGVEPFSLRDIIKTVITESRLIEAQKSEEQAKKDGASDHNETNPINQQCESFDSTETYEGPLG